LSTPAVTSPDVEASRPIMSRADLRQFRRKAVIWAAKLETDQGTFECITLDLSLGGARLRCTPAVALLARATLVLGKFGRFPAEVVWTTATELGLQFTETPEQVAARFGDVLPLGVTEPRPQPRKVSE
jgi:hypothetical protein